MDKEQPKIIIMKESLAQSLLSDLGTFGFILLCIWTSWKADNLFWQFVIGAIGLSWIVLVIARESPAAKKFYSVQEARAWLDSLDQ